MSLYKIQTSLPEQKEVTLPLLSQEQEVFIDNIKDPVIKAETMISILRLGNIGNEHASARGFLSEATSAYKNVMDDFKTEEKIEELFWQLKTECEEMGLPLFNRLKISDLMTLFHPKYSPEF